MRRKHLVLVPLLLLALAGCGGGDGEAAEEEPELPAPTVQVPEGELSVAQAKQQGGTGITVNGRVYVRLDEWMICHTFDETIYPPGCVEPSLRIANPDALGDLKLVEGVGQGAGLEWSARPVSLTGDLQGDSFTVSSTG